MVSDLDKYTFQDTLCYLNERRDFWSQQDPDYDSIPDFPEEKTENNMSLFKSSGKNLLKRTANTSNKMKMTDIQETAQFCS